LQEKFLSNIDKRDVDTLRLAAKETGTRIRISPKGTKFGGVPVKDCSTVFTLDPKQDHSDMWVRYHELKNDWHARRILSLDYLRYRPESY
jgi:hypothetical protein